MKSFIHEKSGWPNFKWDASQLIKGLSEVSNLQGRLLGKMQVLGFELREEAVLETLTEDIVKSNEIEGEFLHPQSVRSSIARRMGIEVAGVSQSDRFIEGVVDIALDATRNFDQPLTAERLFDWHSALFPTGRSGMYRITVGDWRKDEHGPMQVVLGPVSREKVHYQAPEAGRLSKEMKQFLQWFNEEDEMNPLLKAGIGHFWFVAIHPFDDGNGRIGRAISDMLLARADKTSQRFYSISAQIKREQKSYYDILEVTVKGGMDITPWLLWFLDCLQKSLESTELVLAKILKKAQFWEHFAKENFNERQQNMLNILFADFFGKLTSSKWAKMTKCSRETAIRDLKDLVQKGVLEKAPEGGRSTAYVLAEEWSW